ncbi:MAG: aldolase [Anaerolineae bacterium]|nr:aldolase [Anaerolineae bacterium]
MLGLKTHRWNRIFREDGKAFIVAMDHPGSFGMMEGMENPGAVLRKISAAGADAVLTTYGVVTKFAEEIGNMGIVLRVDGGTSMLAKERNHSRLLYHVTDALRVGADAVGSMGMPGSIFEAQTLPYVAELVNEAAQWNVPVMVEALPGGFENPKEWWTPENIGHACRICGEMGVDFIKTTYTGDVESFRRILEQLYVPVVVLGGSKSKDPRDLLGGIYDAIQAGASGVAVGRNIWHYADPGKMTAAIAAIIHDGATVDDALEQLA